MPTELDNLEIRISSDATKASKAIDNIAASLGKLKSASKEISDLSNIATLISGLKSLNGVTISPSIANQLTKIGAALNGLPTGDKLTELIREVAHLGEVSASYSGIARDIRALSKVIGEPLKTDNMDKAAAAVNDIAANADKAGDNLGQVSETIARTPWERLTEGFEWKDGSPSPFGLTEIEGQSNSFYGTLLNYSGPIKDADTATSTWKQDLRDVLGIAKTLVSPFVSLAKWSGKIVFKGLAKSAQLALSPIKKLISGTKNLFRSIARIAMYRAIRTFIKLITEGLKEGIDAMYSWSKEMGGQFAASMDTIATKTHYIGRSLAAMLAPLINLGAVIIGRVTPAFVGMINVFNKFLATLTGQDYFTVAIEGLVEYGDTISGAADKSGRAAKEIRDAVVGIDELNIISQNTGSGSDNTVDGGTFVDEFLNENDKSGFAAQLAEAIGEQDWTKVGTTIAEKINDIFTDKTKIKNLSKKVGTFIKGALNLVSGLLGKVDFAGIGSSIAGFLNGIFDEFDDTDSYNLGKTLADAITALPKAAVGFMSTLNWTDVGSKLGTTLGGALSGIAQFITETDWGTLAKGLGEGLAALITNGDLLAGIANLATGLASALITATNSALDGFSTGVLNAITRDPDTGEGLYEGDKWTTFVRDYGSKDITRHNNAAFEKWLQDKGYSKGSYSAAFMKHPNGYANLYGLYTQFYASTQDQAENVSRNWVPTWLASMGLSEDTMDEYSSDLAKRYTESFAAGMNDHLGDDYWDEIAEPWSKGTNKMATEVGTSGGTQFGKSFFKGANDRLGDDYWDEAEEPWIRSAKSSGSKIGTGAGQSFATSFKAAVSTWLGDDYWDEFEEPWAKKNTKNSALDASTLNKYASGAYMSTAAATITTQSSLVATGFEEGMERLINTYFVPVLNQIALDTTTTANKPDPVIELDGRTLAKAVNNQNRINGYSFS